MSVYNPTHFLYTANIPTLTGNPLRYEVKTSAGYVMDTATFRDAFILTGGVRFDDYKIGSANNVSARSAHSDITSFKRRTRCEADEKRFGLPSVCDGRRSGR